MTAAQESPTTTAVDPVCGMSIDIEDARANRLLATHEGTEYAFCCQGCMGAFEADPQRYHDPATSSAR